MVSITRLHLKHLRLESRLISAIMCSASIFDLLDPAYVMLRVPESLLYRITWQTHHPRLVIGVFLLCAVLQLPYLLMHLFDRWRNYHRLMCKLMIVALAASAFMWAFLCFTSWNNDVGDLSVIFIRSVVGSLTVAGFLASLLNSELKVQKELEERRQRSEDALIRRLNMRQANSGQKANTGSPSLSVV